MKIQEATNEEILKAAKAIGINIGQTPSGEKEDKDPSWVIKSLAGPVPEGSRDNTCASLAGHFLRMLPKEEVEQILLFWASEACDPPFPDEEVRKCLNSIAKKSTDGTEDLSFFTLGDSLSSELEEIPEILNNWCRKGDITLVVGGGGVGKSTIALPLGLSVASGQDFLGSSVGEAGPVLYLDLEMGPYEIRVRMNTLAPFFPVTAKDRFYAASLSSFRINSDADWSKLVRALEIIEPRLLIVDNHARFHSGDPNKEADMMQMVVLPFTKLMKMFDMGIVYLMHTPWSDRERPRGTMCIFDAASTVIAIGQGGSSPRNRVVKWTKNRPARRERSLEKITVVYDPTTFMLDSAEAGDGEEDILASIGFPTLFSQLAKVFQEKIGLQRTAAYNRINNLVKNGDLIKDGNTISLPGPLEQVDKEDM